MNRVYFILRGNYILRRKVIINLFLQNFKRVYALATVALSLGLWVQRIYNWENKAKSAVFLLLYILIVVSFELYMVPMFAAMVIIYEFLARWVGFKSFETWIMNGEDPEVILNITT